MEDRPVLPAVRRRLSLVLPAYNEAAGIAAAVAEADDALARLCPDYEILVVDDGSTDGTAAVVEGLLAARPRVRLLRHECNRGYGAALRTGFAAARFERVAFTDADCQFDLADLGRLLPLTETHDIAAGYRVGRQDPPLRCFLSKGYNLLARALFGTSVRDIDCALKVFRREALAGLLPESARFFVNTEMLTRARQQRLSVAELGVRHRPRFRGRSKVSLADVPRTLAVLLPFWWSRVMFAGESSELRVASCERHRLATRNALLATLLLAVVASLLFFGRLRASLLEPQEPRYAEIPRQMLAEGRWLVPVLHGQPYLDKPPLLYWLVMGSYRLFGVHDWAARLVPGLAGVLTVLVAYLWGRRAFGARAGLLGAVALCLTPRYVYLGRMLTMDGLLTLWVTAGLGAAYVATAGPRLARGWWWGSGVAVGLGLLTKGPVAVALVGVPVALQQFLDPRAARIGWRGWLAWLGTAGAVAAPWYAAVMADRPEFCDYFLWRHNVVRFLAPFDHAEPAWFYLPGLVLGLGPWALLLPGLAAFLARRSARSAARRPAGLGFVLLAAGWCVGFFSAAGCKRAAYILPALPPLALALGCYFDRILARPGWAVLWRRGSALAGRFAFTAAAAAAAVALVAIAAQVVKPAAGAPLAAAAVVGSALLWRGRRRVSWAVAGGVTFLALWAGVQELQPAYNRRFALRGGLEAHAALAADGRVPVFCYPQRWDSVSFYLPRADVRVYGRDQKAQLAADLSDHPGAIIAVKSGRALEELMRALPASAEFVPDRRDRAVVVGRVRPRGEAENVLYAARK